MTSSKKTRVPAKRTSAAVRADTGRRGVQDPALTRKRILDAGATEFATKGFAGARMTAVAHAAKVNVQAIYYHFGNKQGLYRAAIDAIYSQSEFEGLFDTLETAGPRETIVAVVDFMFRQYRNAASSLALIIDQEQRSAARELEELDNVRLLFRRLILFIDRALTRGAEEGAFRPNQDAAHVYLTISALTSHYLHRIHISSVLMDRDFASPSETEGWRAYILNLILSGLRPSDR